MAATDRQGASTRRISRIVLAACALPGVLTSHAHAEEAPTEGVIAFKLSHYKDSQTGYWGGNTSLLAAGEGLALKQATAPETKMAAISSASGGGGGGGGGPSNEFSRIRVSTPSLYALVPINRHFAAEASLTVDSVSGASPQYYSDMRSATHMVDQRKAGDLKLSYYAPRQAYALGVSRSTESDFLSRAVSADARLASEDQNTTWNLGLGLTNDTIDPTTHIVSNEKRQTRELQLGVTQALGARDLMQATFTLSRANGYMNDPYKFDDARPRERNAEILQLRWNHWLGGSAAKLGYRLYKDSYGILANTFDLALAAPFTPSFTLTPGLRYYAQNAASFYANPVAATYPGPAGNPTYFSADQRLAGFGALSESLKAAWQLDRSWVVDAKVEFYQQRSGWHLLGQKGSPEINPLNATTWQLGLSHPF